MRVAILSDIHGNRPALDAVEADFAAIGVDLVVNLGDCVGGPIDPRGVMERLTERDWPTVRGNHDRHLYDRPDASLGPVDRFASAQLDGAHVEWLRSLPATAVAADELFLCHGTPQSDTEPWLDNWWQGRTTSFPDEVTVAEKAAGLAFPVLLCGHTHLARIVRLRDGRLIVNPGAVGLQMNHGAPDARYAVLERRQGRWSASLRAVAYDIEAAARLAIENGFPKWAEALRSGWLGHEGLF